MSLTYFAVKFTDIIREKVCALYFKPHAVDASIVYSYCDSCVVVYRWYNFVFTKVTIFNGLLRNTSEYFKIFQDTS